MRNPFRSIAQSTRRVSGTMTTMRPTLMQIILYTGQMRGRDSVRRAFWYLMNLVFGARKLRMVDGFGASEVVVESPTHNALIGIAEDCQVARCKKSALFQQELQEFSWRHLRWWSILWILWSLFLLVSVLNFPPRWWILWGPWQLEVHAFHLHCFGQRIFLVPFWHRVHHCNDVILVIPKLLQVYSCATCHSYWVLVWCKDVWVMCTVVSCKPCEAVPCGSVSESYSWCFPVAVSLLRDLAVSVSPKRWGISSNMVQKPVAPWSIHTCRILVGIQNIIERRFEGPWVDSVNSMIKNKKLT